MSDDRKLEKGNLGCGCRKTAFEAYAGRPIPSSEGLTSRRLQGRAGPKPVPPALLAGAGMVSPGQPALGAPPSGSQKAARGASCHPLGPSPAASAAREKPTHSSPAIFAPILLILQDHRVPTRGASRARLLLPASAEAAGQPTSGGRGLGRRRAALQSFCLYSRRVGGCLGEDLPGALTGLGKLLGPRGFGSPPPNGDVLRETPVRSLRFTLAEYWGRKRLASAGQRDPRVSLPQPEPRFSSAVKKAGHLGFAELCSIYR